MLLSLHIENIALIRRADIDFSRGFYALTGETGAGKSILIDSIGLILGDKADRTLIRTGQDEAFVSALVGDLSQSVYSRLYELGISPDQEGGIQLSRRITSDGRSKAYINGSAVSLSVMKEAGSMLISILGQSEHQLLRDTEAYVDYLDSYAHHDELLKAYSEKYAEYTSLRAKLTEISRGESERIRTLDMLRFQIGDIDELKLKPGEDTALQEKEKVIKGRERINKYARFASMALSMADKGSACNTIDRSIQSIEKLTDIIPDSETMINELTECKERIADISERIFSLCDQIDGDDPEKLINKIELRLSQIEKLKRKYGSTVSDILAYREAASARLDELDHADERAQELQQQLDASTAELTELARALTADRRKASESLSRGIVESLRYMDMENVEFISHVSENVDAEGKLIFSSKGADSTEFFITANRGEELRPLAKVASGGELSRIMLALRTVISDTDDVSTFIFDEIDTGVSGKTARKLGMNLLRLSSGAQVLCVTHSAQVASLADMHYLIKKDTVSDRTETHIRLLDRQGREDEISRILGGISVTEAQRKAAVDMLDHRSE